MMDAIKGGAKDNALVLLSELGMLGAITEDAYRQLHDAISAIPEQTQAYRELAAPTLAPVLKDEREESAYRKGRWDERLQQQIFEMGA